MIMEDLYNKKIIVEDIYNEVNQYKKNEVKYSEEEKQKIRLENQNKFDDIKNILKENIEFQDLINFIVLETNFDHSKLKKEMNRIKLFFLVFCVIIGSVVGYFTIRTKVYFITAIPVVIISMLILFLITKEIAKNKSFRNYSKKCRRKNITLKKITSVVNEILENYGKLAEIVPVEFLNIATKRYSKSSYDEYIAFIGYNNKNIKKKIKNKRLKVFKGIFSKSSYMFNEIEGAENNYFNTVFEYNKKDSLEEAITSYLQNF